MVLSLHKTALVKFPMATTVMLLSLPLGVEPKEIELPNCPAEAWVANGKCDDETNIPECNYDGGDCCIDPYVQGFCTICVCYDD